MTSPSTFWTLACLCAALSGSVTAQSWGPSPAPIRAGVSAERAALDAWTSGLELRNVGPSVMGGRVVDVAVVSDTMYVAYATGGLWKSVNHGTTFEPLLSETCLLGAVDAHPSGRVLVGSGEVNSSRSSYAGDGVYLSDDHGATWRHAGLEGSHHIGRVIIDRVNPDRMWVAALGELYSDNLGGALYRTTDGGAQWEAVLTVPGVGFVDMVADETDADHLFAASWDRTRRAHDFTEGGTGSGIWESTDGGDSWARISADNDFPEGPDAGRIGLSYHSATGTLFALIDNQAPREAQPEAEDEGLTAMDFVEMDKATFEGLDNEDLQAFLDREGFEEADSAAAVKARVASGELPVRALYDYLTDGNRALFEAEIVGPELYRYRVSNRSTSSQGGASAALSQLADGQAVSKTEEGTWVRTHDEPLDDVCYTYGYYFGTVSVDPSNASVIYIAGVPLLKSTDSGSTFTSVGASNVHVDHHKLWVDPSNPNHLINGNDGGINVSWDGGDSWIKCNSPSVGQFYAVEVDQADPYRIYGGLQDNGTWVGDHTHRESPAWHQTGHHGFTSLGGGDGMQIEVDSRSNEVVYTGYQFGWYMRTDRTTGERTSLHPSHALGETPLRWNWQTPIVLSKHQQDVFYMASNKVHRSLDRGDTFETRSDDLTRGGLPGNVPFGTLTTLAEHPAQFGVLATGSDDGLVHISPDGGHTWNRLKLPLPTQTGKGDNLKHLWVSEVSWSQHDPDLLVVALNGYRHDCLDAMVFATRDAGKSWEDWGQYLPHEPVNALVESADRAGWWIVGTDGGAYLTTDAGTSFSML
ncbi:MAG: glycosyl hydrolase, partial [Bacteroidota bacterium]|nr:glycosyl hydrolase [Bacteroidota bacterium]